MPQNTTLDLLILDRTAQAARDLVDALQLPNLPIEYQFLENPEELAVTIRKQGPDMLVVSTNLPGVDVAQVASFASSLYPPVPVIAVADDTFLDNDAEADAMDAGLRDLCRRDRLRHIRAVICRETGRRLGSSRTAASGGMFGGAQEAGEAMPVYEARMAFHRGALVQATDACTELLGYDSEADMLRLQVTELLDRDSQRLLKQILSDGVDAQEAPKPVRVKDRYGKWLAVQMRVTSERVDDKPCIGLQVLPAVETATVIAERVQEDPLWTRRLKAALERDQFALASQPISALVDEEKTGQTAKVDVLLRLMLRLLDDGQERMPAEFIQHAQQAGIMPAIDRWVISQACALVSKQTAEGKSALYFLRLSAESVEDDGLLPWLHTQLTESGVRPTLLSFELREQELMTLPETAFEQLRNLKEMGARLTVSHFGENVNGLRLLDDLPFDYVKLSPELTARLNRKADSRNRLAHLVSEARKRDMLTIATKVEDASKMSALWNCRVNYIQGNYVSTPQIVMAPASLLQPA